MGDTQVGWRHFAAAEWAEARDCDPYLSRGGK